jgi:hypothetical protein
MWDVESRKWEVGLILTFNFEKLDVEGEKWGLDPVMGLRNGKWGLQSEN